MSFNSWQFLIFLSLVVLVYWLLPHRARWAMLLVASYIFYMSWNVWLIVLIMITTVTAYGFAIGIEGPRSVRLKKLFLAITLIICLGLLVFFKYINFLIESVVGVIRLFNAEQDDIALNILLPVGISFYTFQTLSYVIDVYRGDYKSERHFGYFALYVSYFPQLVAGPIEKPQTLLPQLRREHKFNEEDMLEGGRWLLSGFFRKCVVAGFCGIFVNRVYVDLGSSSGLAVLVASALFLIQIYNDFAGYSEIAMGSARLMGVKLSKNFDKPLTSTSYTEFFRRWHITLNQWFTQYVYIPLGGNRKGTVAALRATRCPKTVLLAVALGAAGALVALTDPHSGVKDFIGGCGVDIKSEFYITNEALSGDIGEREGWQLISGGRAVDIPFDEAAAADGVPFGAADDPFMIIFTSGSTGRSKAVVLSHKNCVANPVDAMPLFGQNAGDTAIALLPLDHVFGFAVPACATFCGHSVVFPRRLDTEGVLGCIEKYNISVIYAVPSFFLGLLSGGAHRRYRLSSLRLGLMAGAPFTADQLRYIEGELGLKLMPGYGMSECVGISTMSYGASVEERATGVGRLYPMTEIRFTEGGEICVRGATLMLGYYNDEAATAEAIDKDGYLHTGDLGYIDGEGFLHVNGRIKDIIIRNGNNLSAVEIERKILSLPQVRDVCVVGMPDDKEGEVPCAVIVGRASELSAALTKIEVPQRVIYADKIPLTSSGKPDKQAVKKMFAV